MENKAPKFENPKLIDLTIGEIQDGLVANLGWLNKAFGRAQRLVKIIDGKKRFTPNIYLQGNSYFPVAPDSKIGNFSFFYLEDPQNVELITKGFTGNIITPFSLIFWFDLRTIYNDPDNRNTEQLKSDILKLLNGGILLRTGRMKINKIYEQAENIYRGFSLDEVDNQFLMHPFAGFRFTGEMIVFENC